MDGGDITNLSSGAITKYQYFIIVSFRSIGSYGATVGFKQHISIWGEDSSLRSRVVTNQRAGDARRHLTVGPEDNIF